MVDDGEDFKSTFFWNRASLYKLQGEHLKLQATFFIGLFKVPMAKSNGISPSAKYVGCKFFQIFSNQIQP